MLLSTSWWEGMHFLLKIYWIIAVPATVFFILQMISALIGFDSPDDFDTDVDGEHNDTGFHFFTLKNLVTFLTFLSWTGILCFTQGFSLPLIIIYSVLSGVAIVISLTYIFYLLSKLNADGTVQLSNAVGLTGEVYLTVPAKLSNPGKVEVTIQGASRIVDALNEEDLDIPTGTRVKITGIKGSSLLVTTHL